MKKVLFAFVLTLAVCACSSNNGTYDICYVDFTDEEKALFEQEIGVNDKLYLADLAEKYKVSDGSIINVIKLDSLSTLDDIFDLDKKIATVTLNLLNEDKALGLNDEVIKNIMNQPYTIVNDFSCAGMYYDFGAITATYVLFGDEVSYTSWPLSTATVTEWTKERKAEAEYKDKSETDLRALLHIIQISRGEYPGFYSGITKTLSTGQKVRINFTAELK
jgi:hypothetical protein